MTHKQLARLSLTAAALLGTMTAAALANPDYNLLMTIGVPVSSANSQGGAFTAFDISYVDPVTGDYYVADRSNAAVDIISGATDTVLSQAGVGLFGGQQSTTSKSGPDGVVVADNGTTATLFAGNGNVSPGAPGTAPSSTLLSFNVTNPALPTAKFAPLSTGGVNRVDEMAFSGTGNSNPAANNLLMVANNAEPGPPTGVLPFATLVNGTTGTVAAGTGKIFIPNTPPPSAGGGLEQSVWDPNTQTFFVSVPAFNGAGNPGGVEQIGINGNPIQSYDFSTLSGGAISSCSPAGLGLGANGNLMVGCSVAHSQTVVLNPTANGGAGAIVTTLSGVSGTDELWYDPVTGRFFVTGVNASGDRVIAVVDGTDYAILQSIDLTSLGVGTVNAHSVAVDPFNGDIFVPLEGNTLTGGPDALCPSGCIAVFAAPEPPSLAIFFTAFLGVVTAVLWRRRGSAGA